MTHWVMTWTCLTLSNKWHSKVHVFFLQDFNMLNFFMCKSWECVRPETSSRTWAESTFIGNLFIFDFCHLSLWARVKNVQILSAVFHAHSTDVVCQQSLGRLLIQLAISLMMFDIFLTIETNEQACTLVLSMSGVCSNQLMTSNPGLLSRKGELPAAAFGPLAIDSELIDKWPAVDVTWFLITDFQVFKNAHELKFPGFTSKQTGNHQSSCLMLPGSPSPWTGWLTRHHLFPELLDAAFDGWWLPFCHDCFLLLHGNNCPALAHSMRLSHTLATDSFFMSKEEVESMTNPPRRSQKLAVVEFLGNKLLHRTR